MNLLNRKLLPLMISVQILSNINKKFSKHFEDLLVLVFKKNGQYHLNGFILKTTHWQYKIF